MEVTVLRRFTCDRSTAVQTINAQQRSVSTLLCQSGISIWTYFFRSFDEVHFGKFASRYIKTQYFVDVHPPLAKLLITLAAFVFGYDGQFDFKDIAKYVFPVLPKLLMALTVCAESMKTFRTSRCEWFQPHWGLPLYRSPTLPSAH
jgi:hypothetical protein